MKNLIDTNPKGECSTHCWPSILSSSNSTSESGSSHGKAKPTIDSSCDTPVYNTSVGEHSASDDRPGAVNGDVQNLDVDIEQPSSSNKRDITIAAGRAYACSAKRFKKCRSGISGSCPTVRTIDLYCEACHG